MQPVRSASQPACAPPSSLPPFTRIEKAMFCALSGEIPQEPVVSVKSGHVFEKRLIVQHIEVRKKNKIRGRALFLFSCAVFLFLFFEMP